jgi:hypothetical protein
MGFKTTVALRAAALAERFSDSPLHNVDINHCQGAPPQLSAALIPEDSIRAVRA